MIRWKQRFRPADTHFRSSPDNLLQHPKEFQGVLQEDDSAAPWRLRVGGGRTVHGPGRDGVRLDEGEGEESEVTQEAQAGMGGKGKE